MRTVVAAALAVAALGAGAAPAEAARSAVTAAAFAFVPERVVLDRGGELTFANLDLNQHNVVSDALDEDFRPLFSSGDAIGIGTDEVEGVSALPPGSYGFYCDLHSFMTGTLEVVETPLP